MSYSNLFGSGEHLRNLGYFSAIVHMAAIDGEINELEEVQLRRFASKLDISETEYLEVIKNPKAYTVHALNTYEHRLERLHDLFKIIYADHEIDEEEVHLIKKYALALGFTTTAAEPLINRSIQIFSGRIDFEDYKYLVEKNKG
jgi:uncharacterized tellurite resistance protein B-like protein